MKDDEIPTQPTLDKKINRANTAPLDFNCKSCINWVPVAKQISASKEGQKIDASIDINKFKEAILYAVNNNPV